MEVVGISARPSRIRSSCPTGARPPGAPFRFHQLDLNRDLDRIMDAIRDFAPDSVVNFRAQGMVAESWQRPEDWFQDQRRGQRAPARPAAEVARSCGGTSTSPTP